MPWRLSRQGMTKKYAVWGTAPRGHPAAQTPTLGAASPKALLRDLACDHQPLDFAGALIDLGDLGIAEEALDRILL
jgi:hypothetical protein